MKTLSLANAKPVDAGRAPRAGFRLRVWHMLFGALLASLLGWAALFLLIDLATGALHWIKA
jgi:hypothetical protein